MLDLFLLFCLVGVAFIAFISSPNIAAYIVIAGVILTGIAHGTGINSFRLLFRLGAVGVIALLVAQGAGLQTAVELSVLAGGAALMAYGLYYMVRSGFRGARGSGWAGFMFLGVLLLAVTFALIGPPFRGHPGGWPPPVPFLYYNRVRNLIRQTELQALDSPRQSADVTYSDRAAGISGTVSVGPSYFDANGLPHRRGTVSATISGVSYSYPFAACRAPNGWINC